MIPPDTTGVLLAELIDLSGRPALVTGGGRGIGAAIASRLAEAGALVAVADVDGKAAEQVAARLGEQGRTASACLLDVTDREAFAAAVQDVGDRWGALRILVNNAGCYPVSPVLQTPVGEWDLVQEVNLKSAFTGSQLGARAMVNAGVPGVIINLSSVAGIRLTRGNGVAYSAAKAGVAMLTENLGAELGPHGIRAVGLAPGFVVTEGVAGSAEYRDTIAGAAATIPLGRTLTPDDIALTAVFLASDMASMITAQVVVIDGARFS